MKMRRPADSGAAPDSLPYVQVERVFGGRFGVAIGQRYEAILDAGRETIARRVRLSPEPGYRLETERRGVTFAPAAGLRVIAHARALPA